MIHIARGATIRSVNESAINREGIAARLLSPSARKLPRSYWELEDAIRTILVSGEKRPAIPVKETVSAFDLLAVDMHFCKYKAVDRVER